MGLGMRLNKESLKFVILHPLGKYKLQEYLIQGYGWRLGLNNGDLSKVLVVTARGR